MKKMIKKASALVLALLMIPVSVNADVIEQPKVVEERDTNGNDILVKKYTIYTLWSDTYTIPVKSSDVAKITADGCDVIEGESPVILLKPSNAAPIYNIINIEVVAKDNSPFEGKYNKYEITAYVYNSDVMRPAKLNDIYAYVGDEIPVKVVDKETGNDITLNNYPLYSYSVSGFSDKPYFIQESSKVENTKIKIVSAGVSGIQAVETSSGTSTAGHNMYNAEIIAYNKPTLRLMFPYETLYIRTKYPLKYEMSNKTPDAQVTWSYEIIGDKAFSASLNDGYINPVVGIEDGAEAMLYAKFTDRIINSNGYDPIVASLHVKYVKNEVFDIKNGDSSIFGQTLKIGKSGKKFTIDTNTELREVNSNNEGLFDAVIDNKKGTVVIKCIKPGQSELTFVSGMSNEYTATFKAFAEKPQVSANSNILSWNECFGAKSYEVYRASGNSDQFSLLNETTDTQFVDNTAVLNQEYKYYVVAKAENEEFSSPKSDVAQTKRIVNKPTSFAVNLNAEDVSVDVSGSFSDGYEIYASMSSNPTKLVADTKDGKAVFKLTNPGTYYVRARAYEYEGGKKVYSEYTDTKTVVIAGKETSPAPTTTFSSNTKKKVSPTTTVGGGNKKTGKKKLSNYVKVPLTIKKVKGAKYQIKYSTSKKFSKKTTKTINTKKTKIKLKLLVGKKYYYKMRYYTKKDGWVKWSKKKSVKVKG